MNAPAKAKAITYVESGGADQWLYIYGQIGTGKTMLASIVAQALMKRHTPRFFQACEMLAARKDMFGERRMLDDIEKYRPGPESMTMCNPIDVACDAELLVLDDLGVESGTQFDAQTLEQIFDRRYRDLMPTIITSNVDVATLAKRPQYARIASRISDMSIQIGLFGKDKRQH